MGFPWAVVDCYFLLQGNLSDLGIEPMFPAYRQILYHWATREVFDYQKHNECNECRDFYAWRYLSSRLEYMFWNNFQVLEILWNNHVNYLILIEMYELI